MKEQNIITNGSNLMASLKASYENKEVDFLTFLEQAGEESLKDLDKNKADMKQFTEKLETSFISSSLVHSMTNEALIDILYAIDEVLNNQLSSTQYNDVTDSLIIKLNKIY